MKSFKEIQTIDYEENGISRLTLEYAPGGLCFQSHWHERLEILYVLSGSIHLYIDEHSYVAEKGHVVIITPCATHKGIAGETGARYEVITFDIPKFTNASATSHKYLTSIAKRNVEFLPLTDHPDIIDAITTLLSYLEHTSGKNPLCAIGRMYELIGLFYQHCLSETPSLKKPNANFSEVLEYISEHFTENLMTKDISQRFGYDNAYFCRKFKAVTGSTMIRYIRRLRLSAAKDLLINTDTSIKDVAWKCGFANISHLSNCFKQKYGLSPNEYRKRFKK